MMDEQSKKLVELYDHTVLKSQRQSLFEELLQIDLRYLKMSPIGSGAMKEIYRSEDQQTGRAVAVAKLKNCEDKRAIESFLREARINAKLQHPNIVPVYDISIDEESNPYFTMKLIPGEDLRQLIDNLKNNIADFKDKFTLQIRLDIFLKICDAIAYAHSLGICHLDLKPENIRISKFGEVMVCDWGLAKFIEDFEREGDLDESLSHYDSKYKTLHGEVKGTPGYMAPEQATGKQHVKDTRTDIFSLGCILYEMLSYEHAILGDTCEEILLNTSERSVDSLNKRFPNLKIPASLEAICAKALQLDPDERYQSVEEIISEINAYRNGFATKAEQPSIYKEITLFFKRNKILCITVISFIILIFFGTLAFSFRINKQKLNEIESLNKIINQQKIIEKTEIELKELRKTKANLIAIQARKYLYEWDLKQAMDFNSLALNLDEDNPIALSINAKYLMTVGDFEGALKNFNKIDVVALNETELKNFAQQMIENLRENKKLTYKEIYSLLQNLPNSSDQLFIRNFVISPYLSSKDNLNALTEEIKWILMKDNNLSDLSIKLSLVKDSFKIDLSNNPELKLISIIGVLPVYDLDVSFTGINGGKIFVSLNPTILNIRNTPQSVLIFTKFTKNLQKIYITRENFKNESDLEVVPFHVEVIF